MSPSCTSDDIMTLLPARGQSRSRYVDIQTRRKLQHVD